MAFCFSLDEWYVGRYDSLISFCELVSILPNFFDSKPYSIFQMLTNKTGNVKSPNLIIEINISCRFTTKLNT